MAKRRCKAVIRAHRAPDAIAERLREGCLVDAFRRAALDDQAAADVQFVNVGRFGAREEQVQRIEIAPEAVVVDAVPVEEQDVRRLALRDRAAVPPEHRPAA